MEKQFKTFPRGLEVLVKKAAVDPEFRVILLEQRAAAAGEIELSLSPVEAAMLAAIPRAQLELIIDQTEVPAESRRVFLGKVAAAMLAALGLGAIEGCSSFHTKGITPDYPNYPPPPSAGILARPMILEGIDPDRPVRDILFDTDQADLRADQLKILDQNLQRFKALGPDVKIMIEGHADERGTVEYNFSLGQRRARAVRDYLEKNGIAAERMATISKGEECPVDPGHTEEAWAKNRRVRFMRIY
jgi:peptidoglycan-associated lipoprotein